MRKLLIIILLSSFFIASCSVSKPYQYKPKKEGCGDKLRLPKKFTA